MKGKAKVDHFHLEVTLANKHDVVWFDVGVQDAEIVEGIQRTEELRPDRTILVTAESYIFLALYYFAYRIPVAAGL